MISIPQAESVEEGKYYIVEDPRGQRRFRYVRIEVWADQDNRVMFCSGDAAYDCNEAVQRGAKFFGPIELEKR